MNKENTKLIFWILLVLLAILALIINIFYQPLPGMIE